MGVLKSLVQRATTVVRADPVCDLSLGLRQQIWMSMGHERGLGPGHARRMVLALETARHVLPLWESKYLQDRTPHTALDFAEEMRVARCEKSEGQDLWQQAWNHMVELSCSDEEDLRGVAAGFSAVQALCTCIEDELFPLAEVDEKLRDNQVDAEDMDASAFASAACAGGPVWDVLSDSARRLQFWEWWLSEAVPNAYRLERTPR
ncbi:Imm5 family immunity protein [Corallococcus sp. Z5C101001]|uniref:Imm5 family immunity protein n=1 Tax=Corallococcus sp. Z5C101001 TaxID=2596829 RepID=UPI00163D9B52|nr:Imm5 family immunity protein [Corallococcus sp. Z5C101001]